MKRATNKIFIWSVVLWALFGANSPLNGAEDSLKKTRRLIREELVYPMEARYRLPATLPSLNETEAKNQEFLRIAQTLQSQGFVVLSRSSSGSILRAKENTSDIVSPHYNLKYELLDLNLILGGWDIQVDRVVEKEGVITATGKRILVDPTRIFKPVSQVLSAMEKDRILETPMKWTLRAKKEGHDVEETPQNAK